MLEDVLKQLVSIMSEGNPGAVEIVMDMIQDPKTIELVLWCDILGIRGSKLYLLNNDCCDNDRDKFIKTIYLLHKKIFSEEDINTNLSLRKAIPFIDDSIKIDYNEELDESNSLWNEYCLAQKNSFNERLKEALENQNSFIKKLPLV